MAAERAGFYDFTKDLLGFRMILSLKSSSCDLISHAKTYKGLNLTEQFML